jgi:hypothetical protein
LLLLEGVYSAASPCEQPRWHEALPPTDEDVERLCLVISRRVVRLLRRRGLFEETFESDEGPSLFDALAAASVQGRSALPSEAGTGTGMERLGAQQEPESTLYRAPLCAQLEGFSLHAGVLIPRGQRARLEHLCRYVARPALATGRLSLSRRGNILLRLKKPWRDGTTQLCFEPLAFVERLASLVPRPRVHQLTYHGVLAPAAALRDHVVPSPPSQRAQGEGFAAEACDPRYSWAELMKRVFSLDVLRCHACGNRRQMIALITQPEVIRRILVHLGLPPDPPPLAPARSPPQLALAY